MLNLLIIINIQIKLQSLMLQMRHFELVSNIVNEVDGVQNLSATYEAKRSMSTPSISRDTIAVLVGSEDLASQYVHETGNIYMSRGHLAPKADFMYTSWQVIMLPSCEPRKKDVNRLQFRYIIPALTINKTSFTSRYF